MLPGFPVRKPERQVEWLCHGTLLPAGVVGTETSEYRGETPQLLSWAVDTRVGWDTGGGDTGVGGTGAGGHRVCHWYRPQLSA